MGREVLRRHNFRLPPRMVCTDGERAIINAMSKMRGSGMAWEECKLQVSCVFHISKRFWTHIHPLFTGNPDGWKKVQPFTVLAQRKQFS